MCHCWLDFSPPPRAPQGCPNGDQPVFAGSSASTAERRPRPSLPAVRPRSRPVGWCAVGRLASALALLLLNVLEAQTTFLHTLSSPEAPSIGWHLPGTCGTQGMKEVGVPGLVGQAGPRRRPTPQPQRTAGHRWQSNPMLVAPATPAARNPFKIASPPPPR